MDAGKARELALALPGAVEKPHHELTSFRMPGAKGRIFATMTHDGAELRVFIRDEAARDAWIARGAGVVEPLFWGGRRRGVKLLLAKARPTWVGELLAQSWRENGGVSE
ncbi:MmcQ/YjbR family DNA-binding protein [Roseateles sp.]|uniref:MmcQ/YjbR family DNA-binding protein n=1 Tax=Roseateles sp. TaxID=1971397 RepID=UPI0025DAC491|nr:MmcQ/YjbR family DNA-binding protein [Roseateles sp.]MBV8037885.1 MmcQ/YjbR family DNA-binding protein [Roseateles sp.]